MKTRLLCCAAALLLVACAEKPQTAGQRSATQPWDATATGFTAPGFKTGDAEAWETQMRRRAQGQNEYSRAVAAP
jgi:hypothetical protein